jgi:hypothetical protein
MWGMGLEDIEADEGVSAEKARVLEGYWDSRIIPEKGFDIAQSMDRSPKLDCLLSVDASPDPSLGSRETQKLAVERIKNLIRVAQKVYRTGNRELQLKGYSRQMTESPHFSPEDLDLCLPAVQIFANNGAFGKLVENFNHETLYKMFAEDNIEKLMGDFNRRDAGSFGKDSYGVTSSFLHSVMRWASEHARADPAFGLFSHRLNMLSRELYHNLKGHVYQDVILEKPANGVGLLTSTDSSPLPELLVARLNNSAEKVMVNNVDCCITGPYGEHRAASMLYWLDKSVFTWEMYAIGEKQDVSVNSDPFGLGIFVKTIGKHSQNCYENDYLVLEGFPAKLEQYAHIGLLKPITGENMSGEYKESGFNIPKPNVSLPQNLMTLPELMYVLGLVTARKLKIPKLFINTGHSNRTQRSVQDSVKEIIRITGNESAWDEEKKCLDRDPLTNEPFASFNVGEKKFQYTHFLRKKPLDSSIVGKIQYEDESGYSSWRGEGFFDTWYWWNHFIGNTYQNWSEAQCAKHPYAERVWRRKNVRRTHELHPESYWNEGIGYCKGVEVDVEKECKRLGIS